MPVVTNIGMLYQCRPEGAQGDVHPILRAALAYDGATIRWVGAEAGLPQAFAAWPREDAGGAIVVPGLIDCHTHLAFGGWRADEFEARILGKSYLEIEAAGGGIASTVAKTRGATTAELIERCVGHLASMAALGVTRVEAKSGYGLTVADELRLLEVYAALGSRAPVPVIPTFLGAHTVPPEFRGRRAEYVALLIEVMLPAVAARKLARFADAFVEESAFSIEEARAILEAAGRLGLRSKLHADQLSSGGGAELAAELGAASADHLEWVSERGIAALAERGVVAVSLPLASVYLNQRPLPARRLIEAGAQVAVATDFNPGSAPSYHLPFAMSLACTVQRMTPKEVLKGVTIIASRAIGEEAIAGSLEAGKHADFAVIDAASVEDWLYHLQANACRRTVIGGKTS